MFADLKLNSDGDIIINQIDISSRRQIVKFNISDTKTQKINFSIYNSQNARHKSNSYAKIMFEIQKSEVKHIAEVAYDDELKSQLIAIKLQTLLKELPNRSDFGSEITRFKHLPMNKQNIDKLEGYLYSILKDDIQDLSISIKPYIEHVNKYRQALNIEIYSRHNLIHNYLL